MKLFLFILSFTLSSNLCFAQIEPSFYPPHEEGLWLVKETDSGNYYKDDPQSDRLIFIGDNDTTFRVLDKHDRVRAEGSYISNGGTRMSDGKWTEYFEDGKVKNTGYYYKGNMIGTWQEYYPNGQVMKVCSYALIENIAVYSCLSGSYLEYFGNGRLKTSGFYKATMDDNIKDTIYVENPVTGIIRPKKTTWHRFRPEKVGTWEYFTDQGELVKKTTTTDRRPGAPVHQ